MANSPGRCSVAREDRGKVKEVLTRSLIAGFLLLMVGTSLDAQERGIAAKDWYAARKGKRVALVIGNGSYSVSPLRNPVNDAKAIAKTLRGLGFEVTEKVNLNEDDMKRAFDTFGQSIRGVEARWAALRFCPPYKIRHGEPQLGGKPV